MDEAMTLILLARALERIGDLCTNIAQDVIFLKTGDIVRHSAGPEPKPTAGDQ
jgi:phosphate uptake regulator